MCKPSSLSKILERVLNSLDWLEFVNIVLGVVDMLSIRLTLQNSVQEILNYKRFFKRKVNLI